MANIKTPEEIQALKDNWIKDPCWDIEDTKGFAEHVEELLNFRRQTELEWAAERTKRENARTTFVREQTGVVDADIVSALSTWNEIERMVSSQHKHTGEFGSHEAQVMAELQMAQIRATLLQAAQLKRIADALENIDDGNSLATTTAIWSGGK